MEFVSGVATNVVSRLASYTTQEVCLAWGTQLELKKLKDTMSTIKLVLEDAEKKQMNDSLLARWLGNLKDVCNDVEDVLDDFDFQKLQQQVLINKSRNRRAKAKVHQFFSRWNPIVFNFKMGHKLKEVRERLDEINKENNDFSLSSETSHMPPKAHDKGRMSDSILESLVIGRDGDKKQIIEHLLSDSTNHLSDDENLSVISIVGLGGLGKTTLAKLVYNDPKVEKTYKTKMWVCVSDDFDIQTLVENIIVAATKEKCDYTCPNLMKIRLQDELRGKFFLLVLDDVWDTKSTGITRQKWIELKTLLNVGAYGSKIMVTTRSHSIGKLVNPIHMHVLEGLGDKDCITLFLSRAFIKGEEERYPHLVEIGEKIVKKCGRVPLAIVTLGSMLYKNKDKQYWVRMRDNHMWSTVEDDKTMQVLKLSYDALPSYLKLVFAFCSLFPKDYLFNSVIIIQLWMAQGYLTSSEGNTDFQEIGLGYIKEFCSRSLFQVETDISTVNTFKIHDLVHDLAMSIAPVEYSTINGRRVCDSFEKIRHISLSNKDLSENHENGVTQLMLQADKLRIILFPTEDYGINQASLRMWISRFKCMRVLDLHGSTLEEIPSSIGNLCHLRFLDLSWNKNIKKLPDSICRLLKLQYLDLRGCEALEELPKDIGNLINLTHLVITTQQVCFPKGTFRGLSLLQTLFFTKCKNLKSLGEDFEYLLDLRQLWIGGCENLESLPSNLKSLRAFDTLSIRGCKNLELMRSGQGIQGLRSFNIIELDLEALPDWVQESAGTLQSIVIQDCQNLMALPEWLKDMTLLEVLWNDNCPKLSVLPEGLHCLTSLRQLVIFHCPELSRDAKRQFKGEEFATFKRDTNIQLDYISGDEDEDAGDHEWRRISVFKKRDE